MHDREARRGQPAFDPMRAHLATATAVPVDRAMVTEVVTAVLTTMTGDLTPIETTLLGEIEALGRTIANAKKEIAALRVDDIRQRDIPFATDELDAIVEHTAGATHAILESCEIMGKSPPR